MPEGPTRPITNPVLVDAMATFKVDLSNRQHEKAFLEAAIEARYLIPALIERPATPPQNGEEVQTRIAFQMMTNQKGDKFMPAFSDEIEMRKNRKQGEHFQVAVMGFMDLYRFLKSNDSINGVVINPFGSNLCLVRQQILLIGDHEGNLDDIPAPKPANALGAAATSKEDQQAAIRQAMADMEAAKKQAKSDTPAANAVTDELLSAMKSFFKKQKNVKKAYVQESSEQEERFLLVAIEADDAADLTAIGMALSEECKDDTDLPFDCVASTSIRAKELIASSKPFYEKKRFGIF